MDRPVYGNTAVKMFRSKLQTDSSPFYVVLLGGFEIPPSLAFRIERNNPEAGIVSRKGSQVPFHLHVQDSLSGASGTMPVAWVNPAATCRP